MESEILISVEFLEGLLKPDVFHPAVAVAEGPGEDARIIGVEWRPRDYCIALLYDRPVNQPVFKMLKLEAKPGA